MTEQTTEAQARDAWGRIKATKPSPADIIEHKAPAEGTHTVSTHREDLDVTRTADRAHRI